MIDKIKRAPTDNLDPEHIADTFFKWFDSVKGFIPSSIHNWITFIIGIVLLTLLCVCIPFLLRVFYTPFQNLASFVQHQTDYRLRNNKGEL